MVCGRYWFKPKEDINGFPNYNVSICSECKKKKERNTEIVEEWLKHE